MCLIDGAVMAEEKKQTKRITVQIQGGFTPPGTPVLRGTIMSADEKGNVKEGFVPSPPPTKPGGKEDKGFVPPPPPQKPPQKPPAKPGQGKK